MQKNSCAWLSRSRHPHPPLPTHQFLHSHLTRPRLLTPPGLPHPLPFRMSQILLPFRRRTPLSPGHFSPLRSHDLPIKNLIGLEDCEVFIRNYISGNCGSLYARGSRSKSLSSWLSSYPWLSANRWTSLNFRIRQLPSIALFSCRSFSSLNSIKPERPPGITSIFLL